MSAIGFNNTYCRPELLNNKDSSGIYNPTLIVITSTDSEIEKNLKGNLQDVG